MSIDTIAEEEVVLSWKVHLVREEPRKLVVVILATVAVSVLAYGWMRNMPSGFVYGIAMGFAMLGSFSDFLFPITFTLTQTGATAAGKLGKRTIAWTSVKKYYLDDYGIKLSPFRMKSRLEAYRGVYLRFGKNREEVIATVKKLRPENV